MPFKFNPFTGTLDSVPQSSNTAKIIYVSQDTGNDSNVGTDNSPLKTIQAGINKAELIAAYYNQVIVLVTPSSSGTGYNENLTFSQQGVTLQSFSENSRSDSVVIKGTITINLTGTAGVGNYVAASNLVYLKGFVITTASGNTLTFSGTTFQRLFMDDVYFDNTGTGSAIVMTNTGLSGSTKSTITGTNCNINNNNATNATIVLSAGRIFLSGTSYDIQNSNASGPSLLVDGSSAAAPLAVISQANFFGQVSLTDNTAIVNLASSTISSGATACVSTPSSLNVGYISLGSVGLTTTATNTIIGSGAVALLGNVVKLSSGGDIISTVTQVSVNFFPQGALLLGIGATQTTNAMLTVRNGHIKTTQTTAPTVAVANSGTGGAATLSNATDSAGRINYTTGSGSITTTATCTITFNKAHATVPIVVLTPQNANAGANAVQVYVTTTTSTAVLNFAVAPVASTAYTWFYHVLETQ